MRLPRLRLRGPLHHRDATALLMLAGAMIAARVPASFMALLGLPMVVLLVQGFRKRAPWPRALRNLLLWCLVASTMSIILLHPDQLASSGNAMVIMVAILAVACAVFAGGRRRQSADRIMDGLYVGLLLVWALSIFEVVTGFKFMSVLYPSANTVRALKANRFFVAALFPNFNDYSVAMALLCTLVVARMIFRPRVSALARAGRWVVLVTASFFIVHMGSRGALIGLLLGILLVVLVSVRALHPRLFSARLVLLGVLGTAGLGVAIMASPWFNDGSTANRGIILRNIASMQAADPLQGLLGYGSPTSYKQAAAAMYGRRLMDPHNVLAEISLWYGVPALLAYLVVWFLVVRRGLVGMRFDTTWRSVGALCITVMMPVVGIVAASTLRYHIFWLWLIACSAYLLDQRASTMGPWRSSSGPELSIAAAPSTPPSGSVRPTSQQIEQSPPAR